MKLINALKWIEEHPQTQFAIKFIKTDNTIRIMNCQTGIKDDTILVNNPLKPKIDFKARGVVSVYDTDLKQYRCFKPSSLLSIKINGVWNQIEETAGVNIEK